MSLHQIRLQNMHVAAVLILPIVNMCTSKMSGLRAVPLALLVIGKAEVAFLLLALQVSQFGNLVKPPLEQG